MVSFNRKFTAIAWFMATVISFNRKSTGIAGFMATVVSFNRKSTAITGFMATVISLYESKAILLFEALLNCWISGDHDFL